MSNFGIKIDLSKLSGAAVVDLTGRSGQPTKCVVIPVETNHIFVGQKGIYLDLCAFEMKNPKFEATHTLKQSLPKAVRDAMTDEQRSAMPILGDLKPLGGNGGSQAAYGGGYDNGYQAPSPAYGSAPAATKDVEDLPF